MHCPVTVRTQHTIMLIRVHVIQLVASPLPIPTRPLGHYIKFFLGKILYAHTWVSTKTGISRYILVMLLCWNVCSTSHMVQSSVIAIVAFEIEWVFV